MSQYPGMSEYGVFSFSDQSLMDELQRKLDRLRELGGVKGRNYTNASIDAHQTIVLSANELRAVLGIELDATPEQPPKPIMIARSKYSAAEYEQWDRENPQDDASADMAKAKEIADARERLRELGITASDADIARADAEWEAMTEGQRQSFERWVDKVQEDGAMRRELATLRKDRKP